MEDLVACRACFCSELKLYKFDQHSLDKCFITILGLDCTHLDELPQYLCYECAWLVTKFYHFREKCLRAQVSYVAMLQSENEVKFSTIKKLHELNKSKMSVYLKPSNIITYKHQDIDQKSDKYEIDTVSMTADLDIKVEIDTKIEIETKTENLDHSTLLYDSNEKNNIIIGNNHESLTLQYTDSNDDEVSDEERFAVTLSPIQESGSSDKEGPDDVIVDKKIEEIKEKLFQNGKAPETSRTPSLSIGKIKRKLHALSTARENAKRQKEESEPASLNPHKRTNKIKKRDKQRLLALSEYVTIVELTPQEQLAEIVARQHSSNYKNSCLKCELCYKGFVDNLAFQNHILKHEPSAGDLECAVCKLRFKTRYKLLKHSRFHKKKYFCKSCPFVSIAMHQAKEHQKCHKDVTYKCQHCDEVCTKLTSYLNHVRIEHPSEFICGMCGYTFVSKHGLNKHSAECSMQFVSLEAYNRHMANSIKHVNINGCRECGITFDTGEELQLHHGKMHAEKIPRGFGKKSNSTVWPSKCTHCSEEIPNAHVFWGHFRRAHPDQKYPIPQRHICEICGKGFTSNQYLMCHKRIHSEERAYKCPECPKAFRNSVNLQMHKKSHSDLRPYPCDVCSKGFKIKSALDRHYRSHTGVKPYSCDLCGKEFGDSSARNLHIRTVHLKQPAPVRKPRRRQRLRASAD